MFHLDLQHHNKGKTINYKEVLKGIGYNIIYNCISIYEQSTELSNKLVLYRRADNQVALFCKVSHLTCQYNNLLS